MPRIGVTHEFGRLEEVILGSTTGIAMPVLSESALAELSSISNADVAFWTEGQGQLLKDYKPDLERALTAQVEGLADKLRERGVVVHRPRRLTRAEEIFPGTGQTGGSVIFMRDPIVVIGDRVIEVAMRFPFRRRQRFAVRQIVEERASAGDCMHVSMPEPYPIALESGFDSGTYLEGGDILLNGQHIYVGCSGHASSPDGAAWLERLLGPSYTIELVPIAKGFIHLDCVLSLPRPGLALACLEALPSGLPISLHGWDVIQVTLDEAKSLGCNGLVLDEQTYFIERKQERLIEELARKGVDVVPIAYDLPTTFGGGLRCSHHPLRRMM